MHIKQFAKIEKPEESKMLLSISAELSRHIILFATDMRIQDAFVPSERSFDSFCWEDLETHNIFMCIPEDKLGQWDGAISLMLTQLIRSLERRPDRKHGEEAPTQQPILLLLDEFPRLGKVEAIQNAISTLRSKGVTICLIMQSLTQLDKTYGEKLRQIIVDNCRYKAILDVTDPENQKIFSDMAGSIKVSKNSVNIPKENGNKNYTLQISETREPIIYPHEFGTLGDKMVLITDKGFCRVEKAPYYKPDRIADYLIPPDEE